VSNRYQLDHKPATPADVERYRCQAREAAEVGAAVVGPGSQIIEA
jgi:hypothetical protein